MKLHGNLDLTGGYLSNFAVATSANFPENPKVGSVLFMDSTIFICVQAGSLPVWVPLVQNISMHTHVQSTPAQEWTISHNLNTSSLIVQVFDSDFNVIIPDSISTSFNQVLIVLSTPIIGTAVLQRGYEEGVDPPIYSFTGSYTGLVWTVTHNLGREPIVEVIVGGQRVQPVSVVYSNLNQVVITFSSSTTGEVRLV
jgi:hypothetical protein